MASNLTNQSRNVLSKKFMVKKEVYLYSYLLFFIQEKVIFALSLLFIIVVYTREC